ncbi:unnamed protein product [Linum trigynum]|uniref:Uncharacterized protein n=1 Tax=Linum trigynum TaxID=586398 RepID=A0AAV2F9Q6_9ROSI
MKDRCEWWRMDKGVKICSPNSRQTVMLCLRDLAGLEIRLVDGRTEDINFGAYLLGYLADVGRKAVIASELVPLCCIEALYFLGLTLEKEGNVGCPFEGLGGGLQLKGGSQKIRPI